MVYVDAEKLIKITKDRDFFQAQRRTGRQTAFRESTRHGAKNSSIESEAKTGDATSSTGHF